MTRDLPASSTDLERLVAEVVALRNRVTVQYKLIEFLAERRSDENDNGPTKSASIHLDDILPHLQTAPGVEQSSLVAQREPIADTRENDSTDLFVVPAAADWWPLPPSKTTPLRASHGWGLLATPPEGRYVGFVICGVSAAELERAVETIASVQRAWSGFIPLFITDSSDLAIFRKFGFAVEILSSPRQSNGTVADDHRSIVDQREFISRKWGLAQVVDFGHDLQSADQGAADYGSVLNAIQSQSAGKPVGDGVRQA